MKTIVVGVDGSERAGRAATTAAQLARTNDATLVVVLALTHRRHQEVGGGGESWSVNDVDRAERLLSDLCDRLGVTCDARVRNGKPAEVLVEEARASDADLIVVGNKRMQGASRILGPVAKDVAQHAHCSVLIAKTD